MIQSTSKSPAIRSVEPSLGSEHPLTRRQMLLWLDSQLYPDAPYHHIVLTLHLSGELDVARLQRAYAEALAGFDHFRLVFEQRDGEPVQRFRSDLDTALPVIELAAQADQDPLPAWIVGRASRPFDFQSRLFEGVLLRLQRDKYVLYFCQHHVISDGTTVGLFLSDLAKRFNGEAPPERPSYAHYLRHELAYREGNRARRDAQYFEQRLKGEMPPLTLYGRARTSRAFGIDRSRLALGQERSERLKQLAHDPCIELLHPAMSQLVALCTLTFAYVYRVSGNRSLVLATPMPNRSTDFEQTGGLLMEQTFLKVEIEEGETFATLAARVRTELFGAMRHAKHCVSDRGLAYTSFNLLRLPSVRLSGLAAQAELRPLAAFPAALPDVQGDLRDTFGVHIIGYDESELFWIDFDFHRATFDRALQERAKGHYLALLDAMLHELDRSIDGVELLAPDERAQLLSLGRGPTPSAPAPDPLVRLREMAQARPEHAVFRFLGTTLSYAELVQRVGKLAARFRALGVEPGVRVAFCAPRGLDEPLCMLAAWAAGGAYVPLDPSHPPDRLRLVLEDAAPQVLATHRALSAQLSPPKDTALLLLDEEAESIDALTPLALAPPSDPEQAAYVLFTSGSTGRPKGVEVPRRAIANFLQSMAHTPGMKADDRLLAVTTTTFDIAGLELFLPLWVGATVYLADRETVLDPFLLRETVEREQISVLQATPTTFRLLLEAGLGRTPVRLKMLCGGEAMSRELRDALLQVGELWNMYGPTETTVWSTVAKMTAGDPLVTIGRAIDATQVVVLGPGGMLQPEGVAGELCIGGTGVALGYLKRPELTRERFLPDPFAAEGGLLYRTGDLARFLPTGELQCLGRLDHQVKIRGFRIELGEIESCLRRSEGVREVVVTTHGSADDPRLVAYFVGEPDAEDSMRAAARRGLPGYMQPAVYVRLEEFPLGTTGKIDRKQLPAPDFAAHAEKVTHAFANPREESMAALFKEVLGVSEVPLDRDFFALGGDSVRAMQLRRKIQEQFEVELPLQSMFDTPTVRSLVHALPLHASRHSPLFVQLRAGRRDLPPLVCVMGVALYRDLARALRTDRAVYGVHVPLGLTPGTNLPSVEEIASRYTQLILERIPHGPYHLAGLCFGGLIAFEVCHQLLARGHEVSSLSVFDGLLPHAAHYSLRAHVQHLVRDPERALARLKGAAQRLLRKLEPPRVEDQTENDLLLNSDESRELTRRYVARARRLPLPFTLFRATEREEAPWYHLDPLLGWGNLGSPVTVHTVVGSHLSIMRAEHVAGIAQEMQKHLGDPAPAGDTGARELTKAAS